MKIESNYPLNQMFADWLALTRKFKLSLNAVTLGLESESIHLSVSSLEFIATLPELFSPTTTDGWHIYSYIDFWLNSSIHTYYVITYVVH